MRNAIRFPNLNWEVIMSRAPWPEVVGVSVVALATAVAVRGWPELGGAEGAALAGWVQAIGAIGAIAGAFAVATYQSKKAMSQALGLADRERKLLISGYDQVVGMVFQHCEALSVFASQIGPRGMQFPTAWELALRRDCEGVLEAFTHIPLPALGEGTKIMAAIGLQKCLQKMSQEIQLFCGLTAHRGNVTPQERSNLDGKVQLQLRIAEHHWKRYTGNPEAELVLSLDSH